MKFFLIIIVTVFTIYSCKENRNHEKNGTHSLKQKLIGKWGGLDESSPVLQFTVDRLDKKEKAAFFTMLDALVAKKKLKDSLTSALQLSA